MPQDIDTLKDRHEAETAAALILKDAAPILERVDLQALAGKRILLTGASGLVGSYLLACLRNHCEATAGSMTIHAVIHGEPSSYLLALAAHPAIHILRGDLTAPTFLDRLPIADAIIHAAGYGQPGRFMQNPVATLSLNTAATLALFEHLAPGGRLLFISSSEVYSGLRHSPHRESDIGATSPLHPRACYIEGKRCGEAICNAWRERGVGAASARLALAYGPGARAGDARVLNSFIERGLMEKRIAPMDAGHAWRTYGYITDAVELLWHILLRGTEPVYNVGGHSRTTIADLAREIARMLKVPVSFPETEGRLDGAPSDVCLDLARAESEFGKKTYVPLDEGLKRTIAWQKAYRGIN